MNVSSTSSNSSSSTNYGRLTGLATGLDTDGMVKQALAGDQTKIDGAKQELQYTKWQQEAYVGFIKDIKEFNNYFDILKPENMMLSGSYTGTTASSTLSSGVDGSNYLTATTLPGAIKGNYEVQINSLAKSAAMNWSFNSIETPVASIDSAKWSGKTIEFSVNGSSTPINITLGAIDPNATVDDVKDAINTAISANGTLAGKVSVSYNSDNTNMVFSISDNNITLSGTNIEPLSPLIGKNTGDTKLSDLGIDSSGFDLTIAGKTFNIAVDKAQSINDFVDTMKNALSGNESLSKYVNISYSELTKKLTIETKDTGSNTAFSISPSSGATAGNIVSLFGKAGTNTGVNASVSIKAPGETSFVAITKSSNNFAIDGIKYNLVAAKPGDTINLNVKSDASAQVDKFKKFVDKYNELIDKINTKISEKKNYDYKPLTDAQKSTMTESQVTAWETKAKEGILRRDNYLTGIVSKLRQCVYDTVQGAGINVAEIGITTTSNYMDGGKLVVDETKLKSALENKGDLVQKLFTQSSTTYQNKGIFQKFKDAINDAVGTDGTLIKKAGYINTRWVSENDMSKSIATKNAKIKDMQSMMTQKQQRLYSMYAALEQNMNKLNSQSTWLSSSLGSQ
ncbi:flagellar filament capping protein FliD [Clostridium sp. YIM B02505]|uniref:Flagellar hook-associated protein 2 n=1 Tax=Clostridium yunnanense TaxID=2800325 RepID=A0ABS1EU87_9CLOT|nr:flagellar filament capping protein FliD [Clostridium yunnanense]MBK1812934.1 flagellar filament capping protein FliD [Clostridium yunnanense]